MYSKKEFNMRDRVKFVFTGGALDGAQGMIVGKSREYVTDDYIVLLDQEYNGQLAINITEACLERIYGVTNG